MKKQGKSPGHARAHNGIKKKSLGKNKKSFKDKKLKKGTMKFINDSKIAKDAKPLVEKLLSQGEVVKNPGNSPKKNKNKQRNKNRSKKGVAPVVNPDKDIEIHEESSDEEMNEDESTEGLQSPTNSPQKNKNKKKKLGLLASKKENVDKENVENKEDHETDEKSNETTNTNEKAKPKKAKKYILFVGNLPYEVKKEEVAEHFKSVKVKDIRLNVDKKTGKGKGFCFIELSDSVAYTAALKMDKRKMGERIIRVEYTTPGNSGSKNRKKFMNKKTKKLLGQKKQKKGKGFNKKKGKGKNRY